MVRILGLVLTGLLIGPPLFARDGLPGQARRGASPEQRRDRIRQDLDSLRRSVETLERSLPDLLQPGERLRKAISPHYFLSPRERLALLRSWQQVLGATEQLDAISQRNLGTLAAEPLCDDALCFERTVLGGVARLAKLVHGTTLLTVVRGAPKLQVLLDDPRPDLGIPAGSFARFRALVLDEFELGRLLSFAHSSGLRLASFYAGAGAQVVDRERWLQNYWVRHREAVQQPLLGEETRSNWFSGEVSSPARSLLFRSVETVVQPIAVFLGRTKVKRPGRYLVRREQMHAMTRALQPGDLLLEKTSGYLCNLFIDGYWGHSILHLGSYEQAVAAFDTPELRAAFQQRGHPDFASYLHARVPAAAAQWRDGRGADGEPLRFIEGDGIAMEVVLSSIGQALDADSLAALRPRLEPLDKALAIVDALGYWQRAYDYAFDVRTDDALVCTELLVKAYAPEPGKQGLQLPVRAISGGRFMIYPSDIAAMYERERDRPDRQLDFVYLLRADEETERSVVADEASFVGSQRWPSLF